MTHKAALAFGIGASLLLAAGAANAAGTCATEVQALQQQLGATESPNATIGPTSPGTQQPAPQANATTGTHTTVPSGSYGSSNDNGSSVTSQDNTGANATIGPTSPGTQQPQNQDMSSNSDTYGSSSSSSSSSKMPSGTVTNTSRSGEMNMSASSRSAALASLKKAELYAKAGEENACMVELNTAKQRMGVQ